MSRFALLNPLIPPKARSGIRQRVLRFARGMDWANSSYTNLDSPILLVGSARGGTTLLANLVGAHPRVNIFHERFTIGKASYVETFGQTRSAQDLKHAFLRYIPHRTKEENLRWGIKICTYHWARADYDRFLEAFPRVRVVFILRDGRDVVLSMLMRSQVYRTPERAAERWLDSVETFDYLKRVAGPGMMSVHYEDLVAHPKGQVQAICDFVGEPYIPDMLDPDTWPRLGSYEITPVRPDKVHKWREEPMPELPPHLSQAFATALSSLGYAHD